MSIFHIRYSIINNLPLAYIHIQAVIIPYKSQFLIMEY